MIIITYKEMNAKELKEVVLNFDELSTIGKALLDGSDRAVFNGQFIDIYKGNTRVYQFGFSCYGENDWYGKEGYELIG